MCFQPGITRWAVSSAFFLFFMCSCMPIPPFSPTHVCNADAAICYSHSPCVECAAAPRGSTWGSAGAGKCTWQEYTAQQAAKDPSKAYFNKWAKPLSDLHPRLLSDPLHKVLLNRYRVVRVAEASRRGPFAIQPPATPSASSARASLASGVLWG